MSVDTLALTDRYVTRYYRISWECNVKKFLLILIVGIVVYGFIQHAQKFFSVGKFFSSELSTSDQALGKAFKNKQSDIQVGGSGEVIKILPDDTQGNRHQKFIIELNSGQTLLIAHNIDIAPRIRNLNVGDHINFYGEYEWNAEGGVVHWTHHDPHSSHESGWINHGGKLYQ
jgi:Protein of unknown function (DUF3465)